MCVDAFPLSSRRDPIMTALQSMLTSLSVALLRADVWIDGSFVTEKIEPDDVDLVVLIFNVNKNDTPAQQGVLNRIHNQQYTFPIKCDSYILVEYAHGHPNYWIGQYMHAYWLRQFGFARSNQMKGIPVTRTPIT